MYLINLLLLILALQIPMQEDIFLKALREELNREYSVLKDNEPPVYYLAYRAEDSEEIFLESRLGLKSADNYFHSRKVAVQVRIGSPQMDNTHEIKGEEYYSDIFMQPELLPIVILRKNFGE